MLSSGILDFAIGMIFTFLAVSLAAGAATEALSSVMKWRAHTLFKGVKNLLNDPKFEALASEVYSHGLINPRGNGTVPSVWERWRKGPAYIEPDQFAAALLDIFKGLAGNQANPPVVDRQRVEQLKATVDTKLKTLETAAVDSKQEKNNQIKNMMHGIIERAHGDEEKIRKELSSWFDNAMDRVSGSYKRAAQLWTFVFALAFAAVLNISTINIAQSLWRQPVDTKAMAAASMDEKKLNETLATLKQLPIGWPPNAPPTPAQPQAPGASSMPRGTNLPAAIGSGGAATPPGTTNPAGTTKTAASVDESTSLIDFLCRSPGAWDWTRIAGWVITAFATLFGAPFWFDALQKLVRLKGSGPSPADKKAKTAAST